jgi:ribosomal protein L37AE/L43A
MKEYTLARCPKCSWVWVKRISSPPNQCQRCKYSFVYPGHEEAELFTLTFDFYREAVNWANEASKISPNCNDVADLLRRMKKK